jgi:hypothetical protein
MHGPPKSKPAHRLSRRQFARSAGLATLFAPFLSVLDGHPVQAQTTGHAKYLLLFVTHGTDVSKWAPQGDDTRISSFSDMTEPLSAIQDSLILMDGVSGGGLCAGHGSPGGLCGASWGAPGLISIDQFISDGLKEAGQSAQIPHLVLGDGTPEQKSMFWRDGQPLTPVSSPSSAYSAIFGGRTPAAPVGGEPAAPDPRLARRQSILDLLNGELGQLKQALGAEERAKLDVHTESLYQIEQRIAAQTGAGGSVIPPAACTFPAEPASTGKILRDNSLSLKLAVSAFGCDLTRIASVQFGHHQNCPVDVPGLTGEWHNEFLHSPNKAAELVELERWLSQEFVDAALQLKALPAPDGDGTVYDQTLMVWARDMGDSVNHGDSNMVYVFAGGAGGYLSHSGSGKYLKGNGGHIKALVTCADAMGITAYSGFGTGSDRTPFSQLKA